MHYYIVLVRIHSSSSSDSWRYCGTATKAVPVALDCGCACYNTSVCFFLPHVLLDNSLTIPAAVGTETVMLAVAAARAGVAAERK